MNILGHEFRLIADYFSSRTYICNKCNCEMDHYFKEDEMLIWHKTNENEDINCSHLYISMISCDEYMIKSIIE